MLSSLLERHQVIFCLGSGGAGKTSMAAAIGLAAARQGHDAVVVTIDPARRLASALGLEALGAEEERIDLGSMEPALAGAFSAMMLAQKPAWDRLITRHAPTPELCARVLANRFYAHLSSELAGAHAYAALDTVLDLVEGTERRVIVDTPPTHFALDLLRAPGRALSLIESGALSTLLAAYRRLVPDSAASWALSRLYGAVGSQFLTEVAELFQLASELAGPLAARARQMQALLSERRTGFVVVSTSDRRSVEECGRLIERMPSLGYAPSTLIVNRLARCTVDDPVGTVDEAALVVDLLQADLSREAASWVVENLRLQRQRARGQASRIETLCAHARAPVVLVPELDREVHDLPSLFKLASALTPPGR